MDHTPELEQQVAIRIRAGLTAERACVAVGMDPLDLKDWMARGEAGEAPYAKFRTTVLEAEAECETALVGQIRTAASNGQWQAAAWLAERRFPERWVRKSVNDEKPVEKAQGDPFSGLDNVASLDQRRKKS